MKLLPLDDPLLGLAYTWLSAACNSQWLEFGEAGRQVSLLELKIMSQRPQHQLRVFTNGDGDPIGVVALGDIRVVSGTATIWCVLGDKRVSGRGHGTEAMRLALSLGFQTLRLNAINTWVVDANAQSRRMVERVGFHLTGIQRRCHRIGDTLHDRWLFDMLPGELS